MRSQLKRVDGEVSALSQRIKALDENLAKSEQYIKTATAALADAVAMEVERRKNSPEDTEEEIISDPLSQFDAQMAILEGKLLEAKYLASKASNMSSSTPSQVPIKSDNNNEVIIEKPTAVAKLRRPFPIEDSKPAAVP